MYRYGGTSCGWINRRKEKKIRMMATLKGKFLLVDYFLNLLARLQDLKKMEMLVKDYTEFYPPSRMRRALNLLPGM